MFRPRTPDRPLEAAAHDGRRADRVGWDSDDAIESDELLEIDADDERADYETLVASEDEHAPAELVEEGEERLNEHYAALQAWQDWSATQTTAGRSRPEALAGA